MSYRGILSTPVAGHERSVIVLAETPPRSPTSLLDNMGPPRSNHDYHHHHCRCSSSIGGSRDCIPGSWF